MRWLSIVFFVACRAMPTAASQPAIPSILHAFEQHPIVLIGEAHGLREAGQFYMQLVRDPAFARTVQTIVVEFASRQTQPILDRYIAGEDVPLAELRHVWRDTTKVASWDSPIYSDWLAAIREVNAKLPAAQRIHVLAGDTAIDWASVRDHATWAAFGDNNRSFSEVILGVLARKQRALVVLGSNHVMKSGDRHGGPNTTTLVEANAPGSTYVVLLSVPAFHDDALEPRLGSPPSLTSLAGTSLAKYGDALLFLGRDLGEVDATPESYEPAYRVELDRRALIEWGDLRHHKLLGIP